MPSAAQHGGTNEYLNNSLLFIERFTGQTLNCAETVMDTPQDGGVYLKQFRHIRDSGFRSVPNKIQRDKIGCCLIGFFLKTKTTYNSKVGKE